MWQKMLIENYGVKQLKKTSFLRVIKKLRIKSTFLQVLFFLEQKISPEDFNARDDGKAY